MPHTKNLFSFWGSSTSSGYYWHRVRPCKQDFTGTCTGQQAKPSKMQDNFKIVSLECKLYFKVFVLTVFLAYIEPDAGECQHNYWCEREEPSQKKKDLGAYNLEFQLIILF